jgi:hypothetical protein
LHRSLRWKSSASPRTSPPQDDKDELADCLWDFSCEYSFARAAGNHFATSVNSEYLLYFFVAGFDADRGGTLYENRFELARMRETGIRVFTEE